MQYSLVQYSTVQYVQCHGDGFPTLPTFPQCRDIMCQTYTQTPIYTDTPSRQDHLYLSLVTNKPTITILGEHPVQIKLSQGPAQKPVQKTCAEMQKRRRLLEVSSSVPYVINY